MSQLHSSNGAVSEWHFVPVSFISCASSASITWERTASRRRPAFSSHLFTSTCLLRRTNRSGRGDQSSPELFVVRPFVRKDLASILRRHLHPRQFCGMS